MTITVKFAFFVNLLVIFLCNTGYATCRTEYRAKFIPSDFETHYPEAISQALEPLSKDEREVKIQKCSIDSDYLEAMKKLEHATALAAIHYAPVLSIMKDLNTELLAWVHRLATLTLPANKQNPLNIEKFENIVLSEYFGKCSAYLPGCVGNNPLTIREAFEEGNLRERFQLSWNSTLSFLFDHFSCNSDNCVCTKNMISKLDKNNSTDSHILKFCEDWLSGHDPLDRGTFGSTPSFFRHELKLAKDENSTFFINQLDIPLSEREVEFLTSRRAIKKINGIKAISINAGSANFEPISENELDIKNPKFPDPLNLYYSTAKKFGFPVKVSISGSTDSLLNIGCSLGFTSVSQMEKLRTAALGYMVLHRHHSAYEVMVASKSFVGLDIHPNSDFYMDVLKSDPNFANSVQEYYNQINSGLKLPTTLFAECISSDSRELASKKKSKIKKK